MKKPDSNLLCRFNLLFLFLIFSLHACTQDSFSLKRQDMVRNQIMARGIRDRSVIAAMQKVERHLFIPEHYIDQAYRDGPLPIGYGQTISQPYIVAYMTEILELERNDKVLEIGTGSGYQAAILGEICDSVFTIEVIPQLGERSAKLLKELGYSGVIVKVGDGYQGWPEYAPFDAIIVTCAPTHVPGALKDQLKEGGRMIIPVGEKYVQELVLMEKVKGKVRQKSVLGVLFVPMVDEEGKKY